MGQLKPLLSKTKDIVKNQVLEGFVDLNQFEELSPIVTDYGKASQNASIMATVGIPYYDINGDVIVPTDIDKHFLKGYLMSGFGWSVMNEYSDLLPQSQAQSDIENALRSLGMITGAMGKENALSSLQNKSMYSLLQTISIWHKMKKPEFDIQLMFFDGRGEANTSVTRASYILERAMYPRINRLGNNTSMNLTMSAPQGYKPMTRNGNNKGNINSTFGMSARGLTTLHIGTYLHFRDVICTGFSGQFSNNILNTGTPQWFTATLHFIHWKQPTLQDLQNRYI